MNFYTVHFGPDIDQTAICEKVKQFEGDCLQQSSGLIVKSPQSETDLKKELTPLSQHITIVKLDPEKVKNDSGISKDGLIFLGVHEHSQPH